MKAISALGTALALLAAVPASAQIADGSFETQAASVGAGGYCYFLGNYAGPCATGDWTGGGITSGFQSETNAAWPGQPSPAGDFYAFIQSGYGAAGSISQTITLAAGTYAFNWLDAGRPNGGGNQAYDVLLNGSSIFSGATTTNQGFTARSSAPIMLGAGSYQLTFQAANSGGDNAAFIDGASVTAVPEPVTWALMVLGIGAVGAGLRARRRSVLLPNLA